MQHIIKITSTFALLLLFLAMPCSMSAQGADATHVEESIAALYAKYPPLTLRDIYKTCFQDRHGPGHLITDSIAAARYMQAEIDSYDKSDYPLYEHCGIEGNYVRVSLDAVKQGKVPMSTLVSAFMRSASTAQVVPLQQWQAEWDSIAAVVQRVAPDLPGFDADNDLIHKALAMGHRAMRHSATYNHYFHPHYRIVARQIFETEILPML